MWLFIGTLYDPQWPDCVSLININQSINTRICIAQNRQSKMSSNHALSVFISYYSHLVNSGKTIALCWIPSHVGIPGNERADVAAKSALSSTISAVQCPPTDMYIRV